MRIFEPLTLIFQFAAYWLIGWHQCSWKNWGGISHDISRHVALSVITVVEGYALFSADILIENVWLRFPIHQHDSSGRTALLLASMLALYALNIWLLGPKTRVDHYKELFDHWDKWKRMRWKLYLISIGMATGGLFYVAVQASRDLLVP